MNWKLIIALSLFGMAMALATISLVPENWDAIFWLPIFIVCAVLIVRNAPGKYFLHGFLVCLLNCVWITGAHILWSDAYVLHHPQEAASYTTMNDKMHVTITQGMLMVGPFVGIVSGLVLGLFAFIASKLVKTR